MTEQSLAEAVIDFAEIHVLDVRPLPEWQRHLIGQLYAEPLAPLTLRGRRSGPYPLAGPGAEG